MNISVRQILEIFRCVTPQLTSGVSQDRKFSRVLFLTGRMEKLFSDALYITDGDTLSAVLEFRKAEVLNEICFLCVTPLPLPHDSMLTRMNCILIPSDYEIRTISNLLLTKFNEYLQWGYRLDGVIKSGGGIQELLEVSEEYFTCPILAWDRSFDIVACTKSIAHENEQIHNYCELGYLPTETIQNLIAQNLLSSSDKSSTKHVGEERTIPHCEVYSRQYWRNNFRLFAMTLYLTNSVWTVAEMERMEYLFDKFTEYLDRNLLETVSLYNSADAFLQDLIRGKQMDAVEIKAKAAVFHIDTKTRYILYSFTFIDMTDTKAQYLMDHLNQALVKVRVFRHENRVVMLRLNSQPSCGGTEREEKLAHILSTYHAYCGLSSSFDSLEKIRFAYQQAETAVRLGRLLHPQQGPIYLFKNYLSYALIEEYGSKTDLSMAYFKKLDTLIAEDRIHGTRNMELLEIYFNTNSSVSATAIQTNFHRNTIMYRLKRIERCLGVSLEDYEAVLRLHISLMILKYLHATNQIPPEPMKGQEIGSG